jgi:hypothetical protein
VEQLAHVENRQVLLNMGHHYGYNVVFIDSDVEGWMVLYATKNKPVQSGDEKRPHLKVVSDGGD